MMCHYCGGKMIALYAIDNGKSVLYGYVCRECGAFSPVFKASKGGKRGE